MPISNTGRDIYFKALCLDDSGPDSQSCETCQRDSRREKALNRAHDLRRFEIENYWKRATYFWAFQLSAFVLLGFIWEADAEAPLVLRDALLAPAALGALSAFIGWLTSKGSKFWQQNWESHVDALEGDFEGRLMQVIFSNNGLQFSVSRLNEKLLATLCVSWSAAFIFSCAPIEVSSWLTPLVESDCLRFFLIPFMAGLLYYIYDDTRSDLKGEGADKSVVFIVETVENSNESGPRLFRREPYTRKNRTLSSNVSDRRYNWRKISRK